MAAHVVAAMWFQGTDVAASSDTMKVIMWAVCVIALGSLVQLIVLAAAAIGAWKAYQGAQKALVEVKGKAYPMVASMQGVVDDVRPKIVAITENVRGIVEDARPKVASVTESVRSIVDDATPKIKAMTTDVKTISTNFVETSTTIKDKAKEIADNVTQTVDNANQKTRAQVDRVDGIVTSAFNATGDIAAKIQHGVKVPVNEVVGWVNAAKASVDKFMNHQKDATGTPAKTGSGSAEGPLSGLMGMFRKAKQPPVKRRQPNASETLTRAGFPETSAGSRRESSAEQYQAVATQAAEQDVLSDPSSAIAPMPGAQEVVDRFRQAMKDSDGPKPV